MFWSFHLHFSWDPRCTWTLRHCPSRLLASENVRTWASTQEASDASSRACARGRASCARWICRCSSNIPRCLSWRWEGLTGLTCEFWLFGRQMFWKLRGGWGWLKHKWSQFAVWSVCMCLYGGFWLGSRCFLMAAIFFSRWWSYSFIYSSISPCPFWWWSPSQLPRDPRPGLSPPYRGRLRRWRRRGFRRNGRCLWRRGGRDSGGGGSASAPRGMGRWMWIQDVSADLSKLGWFGWLLVFQHGERDV